MEIIIEVGTEEQKDQIKAELSIIRKLSDQIEIPLNIKQLVVPLDFEKKVNQLLEINSYKSFRRRQAAYAKTVALKDGIILIFSPLLYTIDYDYHIRLDFYLHEFFHALNNVRFPSFGPLQKAIDIYLGIIYALFDEYYAIRKSLETLNTLQEKGYMFKRFIYTTFKQHIDLVISEEYYKKLRLEITKFRFHGDVDYFMNETKTFTDEISKALINIFSYLDSYKKLKRVEPFLLRSRFVNASTLNLINYFREKYLNSECDLTDGI